MFGFLFTKVYLEKIRVFKAGLARLNKLAWNNGIRLSPSFVGENPEAKAMVNRNGWGCSYLIVRGEILGFMKDELLRRRSPRTFSLIRN